MKIQLALDFETADHGIELVKQVGSWVDIIEMGTCFLLKNGMDVMARYHAAAPDKLILADAKIMDAGYEQGIELFHAGADIITVLALADRSTIAGAVRAAREQGGQVMLDLINVTDYPGLKEKLAGLSVDIFCGHMAFDVDDPEIGRRNLLEIKALELGGTLACAGGINVENVGEFAPLGVEILIVGRGITRAADPAAAACALRKAADK